MISRKRSRPLRRRGPARGGILVPTDGSAPSRRAVRQAALLARNLGAGLVGVHIVTPYQAYPRGRSGADSLTAAQFERIANAAAHRYLDVVRHSAAAADVGCRCQVIWDVSAADAIVGAARSQRCSLIVMATHGRTGLTRMLLGSVTQKVLAKSRVPVVVCR